MTNSPVRGTTKAFPVEWADPADSARTWLWDAEHFPFPLTELSMGFTDMVMVAWNRLSGQGIDEQIGWRFANGFFYELWRPPAKEEPGAEPSDWKKVAAKNALRLEEHWSHDVEPRIESLCRSVTAPDFESMPAGEIALQLRTHFESCATAFGLTQFAMNALFTAVRPFVKFCKDRWGDEAIAMSGTMLDGVANETRASDVTLFRISTEASRTPEVRDALRHNDLGELRSLSERNDAASRVLSALESYLDRFGWRPEIWSDLSKPTWHEDPRPVLQLMRRYGEDDRANPILAGRRAAARRRRLVRRVEGELAVNGEQLAEFRRLYKIALPYVTVREGRALWQLSCTGVLRRPVVELGRKLVESGSLRNETDILHLRLDEIEAVVRGRPTGVVDLVEMRRQEHERWRRVVPPAVIGTMDPAARNDVAYYSGKEADEDAPFKLGRILTGKPASRGTVTGTVRVVTDLAVGAEFQRGEVLVCRTTSPAWTPLVARASAVVSDSGGPLAHTAIVAREFAIPCVIAVGDATRRLRDGMTVTVDGGQGIVRIE